MRLFDSQKLLSVCVLLLFATLAVNGAVSKEIAVVKEMSFNTNGDSLEVTIAASESTEYSYFTLTNPHRLVVDFPGVKNAVGFKVKPIAAGGVERVRTSYFTESDKAYKAATRIVFDLREHVSYEISDNDQGIVQVVFNAEQTSVPMPLMTTEAIPLRVTSEVPVVTGAAEVMKNSLPVSLSTEVKSMDPPASEKTAVDIKPAAQAQPAGTPMPQPQYTGEIVSFDLKDVDIKDFFRLIANISGLNIILDPTVAGTVTLTLTDVPWDQALDIVLRNNQLGSQLQGNVLRIATNATLQAEENNRKLLRDAQELAAEDHPQLHSELHQG
jgi:type IV pilus assembly protein PilQ